MEQGIEPRDGRPDPLVALILFERAEQLRSARDLEGYGSQALSQARNFLTDKRLRHCNRLCPLFPREGKLIRE